MSPDGRQFPQVDRDGVTVRRTGNVRTGVWLLVLAMGLVGITLLVVVAPILRSQPSAAAPQRAVRSADTTSRETGRMPSAPRQDQVAASRRAQLPPAEHRASGAQEADPEAADDSDAMASAGEGAGDDGPTGIALFPPPGTDPIKPGLVVPEDFELPAGYVRHYQVTDDGKQLPAILMFHPDYVPLDADGEKVALPANRVVPAEMAPPGLPIHMLEVPDDTVPMLEGPNDRASEP
jgi:hypothetical protein